MAINILQGPQEISALYNEVVYRVEVDPNWAALSDYHLIFVLEKEDSYRSNTWGSPQYYKAWPDSQAIALLNFRRPLRKLITADPPAWPASNQPRLIQGTMNARYRVTIEEYHSGAVSPSDTIVDSPRHVMRTGFNNEVGQYLWAFEIDRTFLTHAPRTKQVTEFQPEWLYYIRHADFAMDAVVTATTDTGNTTTVTMSLPGQKHDVIEIPLGFQQLSLASNIIKWEVEIRQAGQSSPISEVMRYELSCACTPLDRYFILENTLGGWDTLRTTGRHSTNLSIQSNEAYVAEDPVYGSGKHVLIDTDIMAQMEGSVNTGPLSKDEARWVGDLLMSKQAYRIGGVNPNLTADGQRVPIKIIRQKARILQDEADMNGIPINYTNASLSQGLPL
mgnify:FL=1